MSAIDAATPLSPSAAAPARPDMRRRMSALFAATLFMSALLLFAVQPMFTKMVLPRLGGSPSVWSVAMVAFQSFLFIGYVYAHVLMRTLSSRSAAIVHLGLLALVAGVLPLGIAKGFDVPPTSGVAFWLVGLFAASIGLPFVALSATAPLLQSWFAATGHPQARNPYVLYAASNLGSFCALLTYPFAIEPFLTLRTQNLLWSMGYALFAVGLCATACIAARSGGEAAARETRETGETRETREIGPPLRARVREWSAWTVLTAVPAGLCIAVTAFITTDIASAPFLWVIPLALYLLTFVAVFRERPWFRQASVLRVLPYAVAPLAVSMLGAAKIYWFAIVALNLTVFVLIALACHGEAYARRPSPGRLTEFYLWTSFGGVVGGVFAGLIAPNVFNNVYEYPLLIVVAVLALMRPFAGGLLRFAREAALPLGAAVVFATFWTMLGASIAADAAFERAVVLAIVAIAMLLQAKHAARFFGYLVLAFVTSALWQTGVRPILTARSFFGVHRVMETTDGTVRLLYHGTTIHGGQVIRDAEGRPVTGRPTPITYYYPGGPISEVIEAARNRRGRLDRLAAIGLGTGSITCLRHEDERWSFFEIDPEVIRLASDRSVFSFLSECGPVERIVPGDARITLAASADRYNLIILDAFSSDAIPVHLLTREAFAGYLGRLAPNGVIAVHISNRHMELANVVAAVGAAEGLTAWLREDHQAKDFFKDHRSNARVVALARSDADLGDLPSRGWTRLQAGPSEAPWTDDYSNVLKAILQKKLHMN